MSVRLREPRDADHPVFAELRADAETQHLLLANPPPGGDPAPDVAAWLRRRAADGAVWTVADAADACIGFAQVTGVHRLNRFGWVGVCIAPFAQGAGRGRATLFRLLDAAREELGLRKVLSQVRADNASAHAMNRAAGFVEVGVLRAHYDDGAELHDVLLLERML